MQFRDRASYAMVLLAVPAVVLIALSTYNALLHQQVGLAALYLTSSIMVVAAAIGIYNLKKKGL